jgi:TusA-related sulfurtransferase
MAETIHLGCLGMKCPRPIIEIAKAARKTSPGSILIVEADDLAFESDVNAWIENARATLLGLEKDGPKIRAQIKLSDEEREIA